MGIADEMIVIAMAARKGGVGKSLLTASLSVLFDRFLRAQWREQQLVGAPPGDEAPIPEEPEPAQVAVADFDPQGSLTAWHNRRVRMKGPVLIQATPASLSRDLAKLRRGGFKVVVIDTPPGHSDITGHAMAAASMVVIPAKPGQHDLDATLATVAMARAIGARFVVAPNDATYRTVSMGALLRGLVELIPSILTDNILGLEPATERLPLLSTSTPGWVVRVVKALVEPVAREPMATGRSFSSLPSLVSAMLETSVLMGASAASET